MIIHPDDLVYLHGRQYTNSLRARFVLDPRDFIYQTRVHILEDRCRGKHVIHLGFVDHTPQSVDKKLKKNKWLHEALCRVASRCYGLDIDQPGVDYVKNVLGYQDVACLDILKQDCADIFSRTWDCLLIPDVLEHQNNPVDFLAAFARRFNGVAAEMIITVPNGFARENHRAVRQNCEVINSDHRYWFTPYTLAKVITAAGLRVKEMRTCRSGTIKSWTVLKNHYYARHPLLRNSIVAVVDV
ncbi:MAG: hypothetical protein FJ222_03265 [Lentisphaerae bacterium]|nr:hypothetical protein [Lentisphaerota bacterium]